MNLTIKRLILKRFRSIPSEQIDFDNPTFLVGQNGSGKSNLVDAFAFLADAMAVPLQAVFDRHGGIARIVFAVCLGCLLLPRIASSGESRAPEPQARTQPKVVAQGDTIAAEAEARRQVQQRLKSPVTLEFTNAPLLRVMEHVAKAAGVKITLDAKGLAEEGITADAPVTISLRQPVKAESALKLVLPPLHLGYVVKQDRVVVTSEQRSANEPLRVRYSLAPAMWTPEARKRLEDLVACPDKTADAPSRVPSGPRGRISFSGDMNSVVVDACAEVHEDVVDFLEYLRRDRDREDRKRRGAERLAAFRAQPLRDAGELKHTDVVPHPDGKVAADRNYVYCVTFQLAWSELQRVGGGPLDLAGNPPLAAVLNRRQVPIGTLSPDCYLAMAGCRRDDVARRVREAMAAKFPGASLPVPDSGRPRDVLAYAYLFKRLPFAENFDRLDKPLRFAGPAGAVDVHAFGIEKYDAVQHHNVGAQVTILDYRSDGDFILQIDTYPTRDTIVLAKVRYEATLAATLRKVNERIGPEGKPRDRARLASDESLVIPVLSLHVQRDFPEITGIPFRNSPATMITRAVQAIRFRLDEQGAILESSAEIEELLGEGGKPPPRHFVFDRPFLVFLQERDANEPYLAMWVANAEVMERSP